MAEPEWTGIARELLRQEDPVRGWIVPGRAGAAELPEGAWQIEQAHV